MSKSPLKSSTSILNIWWLLFLSTTLFSSISPCFLLYFLFSHNFFFEILGDGLLAHKILGGEAILPRLWFVSARAIMITYYMSKKSWPILYSKVLYYESRLLGHTAFMVTLQDETIKLLKEFYSSISFEFLFILSRVNTEKGIFICLWEVLKSAQVSNNSIQTVIII